MRRRYSTTAVFVVCVIATVSAFDRLAAAPPEDAPKAAGAGALTPAQTDKPGANTRGILSPLRDPHAPAFDELDVELAGLPKGSRPEVLTWARVYALAVMRSRASTDVPEKAVRDGDLVRKIFADDEYFEAGPFAQFSEEFLSGAAEGPPKTFQDPSRDVLDVLQRLFVVLNTRQHVIAREQLFNVVNELIQGSAAGLRRLDLDRVDLSRFRGYRALSAAKFALHDRLDVLKFSLGIAPHTPIVLDRGCLAAFRRVFLQKLPAWSANPRREMTDLPKLVSLLPPLDDLAIAGRSMISSVDQNGELLEGVLQVATGVALDKHAKRSGSQGRGDAAGEIELQTRRRVRGLIETHFAYRLEQRNVVLGVRMIDQSLEQLLAPPADGKAGLGSLLTDLLDQDQELMLTENRLVELWASFLAQRLALCRALGAMPYHNWASFIDQFSATSTDAQRDPARGPVPPGAFPAPPAPPAPR